MQTTFPTARFGKAGTSGATSDNEYRLFYSSPDFPHAALREFERFAVAMQWSGGGGDADYEPCFAIWPVAAEKGVLVGRFSDSGADSLHRPHTVLVEAAYVADPAILNSPSCLANLLLADSWPTGNTVRGPLSQPLSLEVRHEALSASRELESALTDANRNGSVFVASHTCYRVRGFDLVMETCPSARSLGKFPANTFVQSAQSPTRRRSTSGTGSIQPWKIACGVLLLVAAMLGGLAYRLNESLSETHDALQRERALQRNDHSLPERTAD